MGLRPGRIVSLKPGFGIPADTEVAEEVIAFAGRRYAVTASGVFLQENDRDGIVKMGFKQGALQISAKAEEIQRGLTRPREVPYLGREEENDWAASLREDLL